jgi:hypothetical protein
VFINGLLGQFSQVQQIQRQAARDHYFTPALDTARKFTLASELGLALCFDIHVQNGGIGTDAQSDIDEALAATKFASELATRVIIANAVANNAQSEFRNDVRRRKLTLATGQGMVHGANYVLENWGLTELPA